MSIKTAVCRSFDRDALVKGIEQPNVKAVIYFFSIEFERFEVHKAFKQAFPQAACIGASMMGGWCVGGAVEKGIVAMSLSSDEVAETFIAMQEGVKRDPALAAEKVIDELKRKIDYRTINPDTHLGLVFFDGLGRGEEVIKRFTFERGFNLNLIGGTAADEFKFVRTLISADGKSSDDGVAVMVLKMKIPFHCGHYVHCLPTDTSFVITNADTVKRIVWEIEGQSAAAYYAKAIGVSGADKLTAAHFAKNPIGIVTGGWRGGEATVYIRSPGAVIDGKGLQFFCYIENGTRIHLLRTGDIIAHARKSLEDARHYLLNVQGALLFNCALRYVEMRELNKVAEFNRVFEGLAFAGFNTFGEEYFTHHNQTLTAVFFGG
ncbi:MAG: FIST C-terminal domain-containing protein [Treponema sp.]|jgi:hypothetical protein|nr:FIST C-terminal domain-containing protein [Treponema sp.]